MGGARVAKTSQRIEANGAIDEANDILGLAAANATRPELIATLRKIQADLFTLGANISDPTSRALVIVTQPMCDELVTIEY